MQGCAFMFIRFFWLFFRVGCLNDCFSSERHIFGSHIFTNNTCAVALLWKWTVQGCNHSPLFWNTTFCHLRYWSWTCAQCNCLKSGVYIWNGVTQCAVHQQPGKTALGLHPDKHFNEIKTQFVVSSCLLSLFCYFRCFFISQCWTESDTTGWCSWSGFQTRGETISSDVTLWSHEQVVQSSGRDRSPVLSKEHRTLSSKCGTEDRCQCSRFFEISQFLRSHKFPTAFTGK